MLKRRHLPVVVLALLAFACAASPHHQSHWGLYPRPLGEARAIALQTLAELGYRTSEEGPARVTGLYTEGDRSLVMAVDIRPAGAECEVQVIASGRCPSSEALRVRNAFERFTGRLDSALRR
jgi:hypothetical protein